VRRDIEAYVCQRKQEKQRNNWRLKIRKQVLGGMRCLTLSGVGAQLIYNWNLKTNAPQSVRFFL
jgi:hypothetical protein